MVVLSDDVQYLRCEATPECSRTVHIKEVESGLYKAADLTLAITRDDAAAFRTLAPAATIATLPFVLQTGAPHAASTAGNSNLLFVGSYHYANRLAVRFLVEEVLPLLRGGALPRAHLTIVGWTPKELNGIKSAKLSSSEFERLIKTAVTVKGVVGNLTPLIRNASVMVAPTMIKQSTGISTKVFMGLQHGMQTVTTPAGKHGLDCTAELVYPDPRSCPQLHVAEPEAAPFAQAVAKAASQEMKLITTPLQLTKHAVRAERLNHRAHSKGAEIAQGLLISRLFDPCLRSGFM